MRQRTVGTVTIKRASSQALLALETTTVARELFSHATLLRLKGARRASLATNPVALGRRQRGCEL